MIKMHKCHLCNYATDDKTNLRYHTQTKKHELNMNKIKSEEEKLVFEKQAKENEELKQKLVEMKEEINKKNNEIAKLEFEAKIYKELYGILKNNDIDDFKEYLKNSKKTNMSKYSHKKSKNKERIPMSVRNTLWKNYFGEETKGVCQCCKTEVISITNFDCGHILSEADGGEVHLENLKPICRTCNSSMGKMNMEDYMKKYGFDKKEIKINKDKLV